MKARDNTLKSLDQYLQLQLEEFFSKEEIRVLRNRFFEHYFRVNAADYLLEPNKRVSESEMLLIVKAAKALKRNEPWQYIVGEAEFYGRIFKVDGSVLIPRPETEELCQWIIDDHHNEAGLKVLDLGTGSGCIPITLQQELNGVEVHACDLSAEALETARKNAGLNDAEVNFHAKDILQDSFQLIDGEKPYDIWVSNPPYVLKSDASDMQANVLDYEPSLALFVEDNDPLIFYRRISEEAQKALKPRGKLYFEIHEKYGQGVVELLDSLGYENVCVRQDLSGRDRMVRAQKGH
ncbi:peptide chain release factor N(5)-glutamine methyltransferase [bacterium SCSIO 12741]|nr:peptide chain release factor N(5)-glutamine methyltransferase [bacterium SCSIO 12741]